MNHRRRLRLSLNPGGRRLGRVLRVTGTVGVASCCLFAASGTASASTSCAPLSSTWSYGVFTGGNTTVAGTISMLPEAIGGNASYSDFSVVSRPGVTSSPALVIGGTLSAQRGAVTGKVYVGTTPITAANFSYPTPLLSVNPVNFSGSLAALRSASAVLDAEKTTVGTKITAPTTLNGEVLTLTGSKGATSDVFNLTGRADADLGAAGTIRIRGTARHATVVINTDLTGFDGTVKLQSTQPGNSPAPTRVVWNFADATSLSFGNSGWYGTILAPAATSVTATSARFQGSVLVGGAVGTAARPWNGAIGDDAFAGCLPTTLSPS